MSKVIVGLSGGVDSAVTAYLLKLAGYDVIGVTLKTWLGSGGKESRCCVIDDARRVAWALQIPYHVLNAVSDFQTAVIQPFIDAYLHGTTPNPCVLCNPCIKWPKMLSAAQLLGAQYIATGHYASVVRKENGRYTLRKALHAEKDQTYMLYRLSQEQLAPTFMPLGNLSKAEVRRIAEEAGLPVALKRDSQEICFVTDGNYADYIEENSETQLPGKGCFVDPSGKVLGSHDGITHYTIGQRKGLGLSLGHPGYVVKICAERNEITVGDESCLYFRKLLCKNLNFLSISGLKPGHSMRCRVKIRYRHPEQSAVVRLSAPGEAEIVFDRPVRAPAPGQSAVFYDEDSCVIGGGTICESFR